MRHDWIEDATREILPSDFSSPMLADIYRTLIKQHDEGREVTPASVLGALDGDAANHLSGVLARDIEPKADALRDYIKTIRMEKAKSGDDALLEAARLYREKKSYGG